MKCVFFCSNQDRYVDWIFIREVFIISVVLFVVLLNYHDRGHYFHHLVCELEVLIAHVELTEKAVILYILFMPSSSNWKVSKSTCRLFLWIDQMFVEKKSIDHFSIPFHSSPRFQVILGSMTLGIFAVESSLHHLLVTESHIVLLLPSSSCYCSQVKDIYRPRRV